MAVTSVLTLLLTAGELKRACLAPCSGAFPSLLTLSPGLLLLPGPDCLSLSPVAPLQLRLLFLSQPLMVPRKEPLI